METIRTVRLGEVVSIVMGQAPPSADCNTNGAGTPFVKVGEFGPTRPVVREWTTNPLKMARKSDVLLCVVGATCGKINLGEDCAIGRSVAAIRPDDSKLDQQYLYYFMATLVEKMRSGSVGAAQTVISKEMIQAVTIPLPALLEQRRMVAILDEAFKSLDRAIANTERTFANALELFESYLASEFRGNSAGCTQRTLGDSEMVKIIDGDRGASYPKKSDFAPQGHCLFLNTKNVRPHGFSFNTSMFITNEKDQELGNGKLTRGDVILTTRGTIGNIGLYDRSVSYDHIRINSGMLIFRANPKVLLPEYLFEVFRSKIMKEQIDQFVSGAAQPQLPIRTLVNFRIPVPTTVEAQAEIVARLQRLFLSTSDLLRTLEKKLSALSDLKASMLSTVFAGQLTASVERDRCEVAA